MIYYLKFCVCGIVERCVYLGFLISQVSLLTIYEQYMHSTIHAQHNTYRVFWEIDVLGSGLYVIGNVEHTGGLTCTLNVNDANFV